MIKYVQGDAVWDPKSGIIAHVVNNRGGWGAGFVVALSKRWSQPESEYRRVTSVNVTSAIEKERLGKIQPVVVPSGHVIMNMCAQDGFTAAAQDGFGDGILRTVALDYDALDLCLEKLGNYARENDMPVHLPRIGSGLGGGHWPTILAHIEANLKGVDVTIYEFD